MKDLLRSWTPLFIRRARRDWLKKRQMKPYERLSLRGVFQQIYTRQAWGESEIAGDPFFSGSGSHTTEIIEAYVASVTEFLCSLPDKPDVVDLGCGDFAVGSRVRRCCRRYTACDIVDPLIARNRKRFAEYGVEFRVLDITRDSLPEGQVAFVRQVFQHLSNEQIKSAILEIQRTYRYVIVTEHLPASDEFTANLDKAAGPGIRLESIQSPSGVELTQPPFNIRPAQSSVLCEVRDALGVIRTTLYEFDLK